MNLERFVREREAAWRELGALVDAASRKPESLGPRGVLRLGELYRGASADLAFARRRFPRDPATVRLEALVPRAWHLVYDAERRGETLRSFFATGYWRRLAERPAPLVVAAALLLVPAVLGFLWALVDEPAAGRVAPAIARAVTERRPGSGSVPVELRGPFATFIFVNNIRVSFLAFAGGIAFGFGTALVLLSNGLMLGTVGGLATGAGNGASFVELVVAHGLLELSCVVVASAAGLRMGWALVDPGSVSRSSALAAEARRSVEIVLGTIPWFVAAGLIEGFITPSRVGLGPAIATGLAAAGAFWMLCATRGYSRARDLARR